MPTTSSSRSLVSPLARTGCAITSTARTGAGSSASWCSPDDGARARRLRAAGLRRRRADRRPIRRHRVEHAGRAAEHHERRREDHDEHYIRDVVRKASVARGASRRCARSGTRVVVDEGLLGGHAHEGSWCAGRKKPAAVCLYLQVRTGRWQADRAAGGGNRCEPTGPRRRGRTIGRVAMRSEPINRTRARGKFAAAHVVKSVCFATRSRRRSAPDGARARHRNPLCYNDRVKRTACIAAVQLCEEAPHHGGSTRRAKTWPGRGVPGCAHEACIDRPAPPRLRRPAGHLVMPEQVVSAPEAPPVPSSDAPALAFSDPESASKYLKSLVLLPVPQAYEALMGQLAALAGAD